MARQQTRRLGHGQQGLEVRGHFLLAIERLLGLSGGIDSALVLAIAVDALGADKVRAVMMPSPYTADISWIDARDMAARLGVRYDEIGIAPQFEAFKASLASEFAGAARTGDQGRFMRADKALAKISAAEPRWRIR